MPHHPADLTNREATTTWGQGNRSHMIGSAVLVTALTVGGSIALLRQTALQMGFAGEFEAALRHFSSGDCSAMMTQLDAADRRLAALADDDEPAVMPARDNSSPFAMLCPITASI
jgi:hypothetical protein